MTHSLRPATPADLDFLLALHFRAMREHVERTWGWNDAEQVERFRRGFRPERLQVIVVGDRDVGVLALAREAGAYFLANIEIDPSVQRRGLGTAILRDILREAGDAGAAVTLRVLKVNRARALYERLGFRVTREIPTHFYMQADPPAPPVGRDD